MFVSTNQLKDLLPYYQRKLDNIYEAIEIENIFFLMAFFVFGLEKIEVRMNKNPLTESELLKQREIVGRLQKGEPIQYITQKAEFYNLILQVNPSVLIPRPETEEMIDLILMNHKENQLKVVDIGTGSGCIPLALKSKKPQWFLTGIDISEAALSVAKANSHHLELNVNWIQKDILTGALDGDTDIIISNPPYVLESDKLEMHKNVLLHEPELALFISDDKPLLFYNRIIDLAKNSLKNSGHLYFEVHELYSQEVVSAMKNNGFTSCLIIKDLQGKDRIVYGKLG